MSINNHYTSQAIKFGSSWNSTMPDRVIRESEIEIICESIRSIVTKNGDKKLRILEIGCGNGYVISRLKTEFPNLQYTGIDLNQDLIKVANSRELSDSKFFCHDVLHLTKIINPKDKYDLVFTIRTIINITNSKDQEFALETLMSQINFHKIIFIECFIDEHVRYNNLRTILGLDSIPTAWHNLYLDNDKFEALTIKFGLEKSLNFNDQTHFLSSHYLATRVISELFKETEGVYNTERNNNQIVALSHLLKQTSGFSPIRAMLLEKH
jgi:SAM-dependent methyltransferase